MKPVTATPSSCTAGWRTGGEAPRAVPECEENQVATQLNSDAGETIVATVCSNCGTSNEPGAEFCSSCHAYLGWEDQETAPATGAEPSPPPPPPPERDGGPARDTATIPEQGTPFRAIAETAEVTVPLDGTPVHLAVQVSNTSTLVDGYVLELVEGPEWLELSADRVELLPGTQGRVEAQLRVVSRRLVPAQSLRLVTRIRNTSGALTSQEFPVQVTVPVLDVPVQLHAEPSLVRTRDQAAGACTIVVDNSRGNAWVQVHMSAEDPENVVGVVWSAPQVQVPPGGERRTEATLQAPPPEPGGETSRTVTVSAKGHHHTATTAVTFVQTASRGAMETLDLRLEPNVLRLDRARRGHLTVTADNRRGSQPVQVRLRGADTENRLRLAVHPSTLYLDPGQQATARVSVTAPHSPPGREVTRMVAVIASDGRADVRAEGSVVQLSRPRRGLARVLLTVLGALAVFVGTFRMGFFGGYDALHHPSVQEIATELNAGYNVSPLDPEQFRLGAWSWEESGPLGLVLMILAGLMLFGLAGETGRLTRFAAVLAVIVVAAAALGWGVILGGDVTPGAGLLLTLAGCVMAYVGGMLARR